MEKLLEVKNLKVSFFTDLGETQAVKDAGFAIEKGDFFGIVGESGSGKSVTTKSILRLGTSNCKVLGGEILFKGEDILKKNEAELREIRGGEIAMIFQDITSSLNPVFTIGNQMMEPLRRHEGMSRAEAWKRAVALLDKTGIPHPENAMHKYPHMLSGGMRQRVMIAMALACKPKLLIADEPTTALDVTIQAQILQLLRQMREKYHLTIVLITHDLGVVANLADRVAVMYAGDIVEIGTADEIYYDPRHPYTWALLSSMPQMGVKGEDLFNIQGTPPNLFTEIRGDAFAPRNPLALKIDFVKRPPYFDVSATHRAKTWLLDPRAPKIEPPAAVRMLQEEGK